MNSGRLVIISATVSPRSHAQPGQAARERVDARAQLRPGPADRVVHRADGHAVGWSSAVRRKASATVAAATERPMPGRYRMSNPPLLSRPMSFVNPIMNNPSTSAKPMKPARSITANGIARPRSFSATAQKMWPPSSGRNGNRLMMPERQRDEPEHDERVARAELERLARLLVAADHAAELLALLGLEDLRDVADGLRRDAPHRRAREPAGLDRPDRLDARVRVIAEPEAVALGGAVVERLAGDRDGLAVALDRDVHRRALVGGDALADLVDLGVEVAGERLAVDRQHGVARLELAGRGRARLDLADHRGRLERAVGHRDGGEDRERQHDVHERPGGDHHDPLPRRLAVIGAVGVLRRDLLARIHAADLHVAAERDRPDRVLGLALLHAREQRREEQREALDPHPDGLRRREMAELVQDHQRGEPAKRIHPAHYACTSSISSEASWRASESVTYSASKSCTRWLPSSSSTPSITAGMPVNFSRPLRKAWTATSLAALSAHGAVPPVIAASRASLQAREARRGRAPRSPSGRA